MFKQCLSQSYSGSLVKKAEAGDRGRLSWNKPHGSRRNCRVCLELLAIEGAGQHLKRVPEGLDSKQLNDYDLIIAMEPRHRDAILDECPECADKIAVWNIKDPYFLPLEYRRRYSNGLKTRLQN